MNAKTIRSLSEIAMQVSTNVY
uniref:Uncharacterized protein n=1 Tax=Anguilla anguilla TaxID=7936 RepID=A0A0E9PJ87_ANGAN